MCIRDRDRAAAIEQAALQCRLAAGEVARCYNLLLSLIHI